MARNEMGCWSIKVRTAIFSWGPNLKFCYQTHAQVMCDDLAPPWKKRIYKKIIQMCYLSSLFFCTLLQFQFRILIMLKPRPTLVRSLACIQFTCIHLCYQLTQAVELDLTQSNSNCIYIDLPPELASNKDAYK